MKENFQPNIAKIVARRIDQLRTDSGMSMRDLSKKSGISKSQIANIISERKIPNICTINSICEALNISLSDFFGFDEEEIKLRGKEAILIKIFREVSPMSQDTLIKVSKCMK